MNEPLKWLPAASGTKWDRLGRAMSAGLPVPAGFIVARRSWEEQIRAGYEELKVREKTHFIAVRGDSHAVLNLLGADALIHTLDRFWAESPEALLLVQRMIAAAWCGNAHWHRKNLRIQANEGMMLMDPDVYLVNSATGKCIRRALVGKQRKMIRYVDGLSKVVEREGERSGMPEELLAKIAELAVQVDGDISWAVDDLDKAWLISV
jgi:phosphoenolpyruvate synthase/pyruvate phosphate dikinase